MTEIMQDMIEEEEATFITLEFDDDKEVECEIIALFDFKDKEYIALAPNDDSEELWFYEYQEIGEEGFKLVDIESEKEFEAVVAELDAIMASQPE